MCKSKVYKCNQKTCFVINAILFSIFVAGVCSWAGVFFVIYYPFVKRDYKKSECTVTDITSFYITEASARSYHSYGLEIKINNIKYRAYSCMSNSAETLISTAVMEYYYPYHYIPCDSDGYVTPLESCLDDQIFLPLWACKNATSAYLGVGSTIACKWWLADKDGETDPAKSKSITYPGYGNSWIEVLFEDEDIYFPPDDYNALWVVPFGMFMIIPLIVIVWINCGVYCCGYSGEFKEIFKYWYTKYIKCKRTKMPRGFYEVGEIKIDKEISKIAFLMALTKGKYSSKFPKSLINKAINYL